MVWAATLDSPGHKCYRSGMSAGTTAYGLPDAPQKQPAIPPLTTNPLAQRTWVLVLVLVIGTFATYSPATRCGFIWDDADHLTDNHLMTAPHGLRLIWSSLAASRYYPLTLTTFWVEHRLWGFTALPYHVVNIVLHAISGVLVFLVLRRLQVKGAWLAAMLWAFPVPV